MMCITKAEDMTMENYPVTAEDRAQYDICRAMLMAPELFRLIYFHLPASKGLHLKHAIVNSWQDLEVSSFSAKAYLEELLARVSAGYPTWNMEKYTVPPILILDEMECLAGKQFVQEEFYRLLQRRLDEQKLTILISPKSIAQLRLTLIDELVDLLSMGLM